MESENKQVEEKKSRKILTPKSDNQYNYMRTIVESDITFCSGPAGSGKSSIAIFMACEAVLDMSEEARIEKIVIAKPVVETGRTGLGYLPGNMGQKMAPYLVSVEEELKKFLGADTLYRYRAEGKVEICPLEYMRGRNFHNSFIILDEAQNATYEQIKMFITRLGFHSKAVLSGDVNQSDLYNNDSLEECMDKLERVPRVGICELEKSDIVRNRIISDVLTALGE